MVAFAVPVVASLVGQILINNSDVLVVKHFFPREEAGHYAALALIGRIVFFATWSFAAVMFPIVAQKEQRQEPHRHLLWASMGLVLAVSATILVVTIVASEQVVRLLFGVAYLSIADLLWLYAVATTLYALANAVVNYELSAGHGTGSWFALVAGVIQVSALWVIHGSLRTVVLVQILIMALLLVGLLLWSELRSRQPRPAASPLRG